MRKGLSDPPRRFQPEEAQKHSGHIGPGLKPGPKRAVNISVDAEILQVAKEMKINLSQTFEDTLRTLTLEERERRFREEIKPFVDSHNALIESIGIFGEELLDLDDPPV
jgi:antitoxin CcdA